MEKLPDFNSLQELPDSYAWSQVDESFGQNSSSLMEDNVPIVDLNDPNVPELIGHACRTWGVFHLINHGIPQCLIDKIENTAKSLFSLPLEQKQKAARSAGQFSGYGIARISPFFSKLMWYEGFTIFGSPQEQFRSLWPEDHSKYCDIVEQYEQKMKRLAKNLFPLMLSSLGISKNEIIWAGLEGELDGGSAPIQLNSYPVCPDPGRAMGLARHTDTALFTILYQGNVSGLQVFRQGAGWLTVPPLHGGFVVNVGDLLHILSNGLYHSVLHRVLVNRIQPRLSVAYLFGPPSNVQISPHPKLVGPSNPSLYQTVTWSEYIGIRGKHFDKSLSSIKLCTPKNVDGYDNDNARLASAKFYYIYTPKQEKLHSLR